MPIVDYRSPLILRSIKRPADTQGSTQRTHAACRDWFSARKSQPEQIAARRAGSSRGREL